MGVLLLSSRLLSAGHHSLAEEMAGQDDIACLPAMWLCQLVKSHLAPALGSLVGHRVLGSCHCVLSTFAGNLTFCNPVVCPFGCFGSVWVFPMGRKYIRLVGCSWLSLMGAIFAGATKTAPVPSLCDLLAVYAGMWDHAVARHPLFLLLPSPKHPAQHNPFSVETPLFCFSRLP